MIAVAKQHFLPLCSTNIPGGEAQLVMTGCIVCFNDLTRYLSVDCFLKASSHIAVLTVVWSGVVMSISIPIGVCVPAVVLIGDFMSIPRLGALLDRVSTLCGGRPLP